jgi:hypothetical protein
MGRTETHKAGALALAYFVGRPDAAYRVDGTLRDGLSDLHALLAERDAARAEVASLREALGRVDWLIAAWLSGDEMLALAFDPRTGANVINSAHVEASRLLGDAGAAHYAPEHLRACGGGK